MDPIEKQRERAEFRKSFFEPKVIRATSAGTVPAWTAVKPPHLQSTRNGGKTKNEKVGKTGAIIFVDCDDAEVARITWERGLIMEDGEQTVRAGCDGETSSY